MHWFKTLKEESSIILLKKSQCVNFNLGHMIDWDALFNLQKNKSIDITVSIVQNICHQ